MKLAIRKLRAGLAVSVQSLAEGMGVSPQAVGKWERGESYPRAEQLPKLAELLHCRVDDLFEGVNEDAGDEAGQEPV